MENSWSRSDFHKRQALLELRQTIATRARINEADVIVVHTRLLDKFGQLLALHNPSVTDPTLVKQSLQSLDRQRDRIQESARQVAALVVSNRFQDTRQDKENGKVDGEQNKLPPHDDDVTQSAAAAS